MRTFYFCVQYVTSMGAGIATHTATVFATLDSGVTRQVLDEVVQSIEEARGIPSGSAIVTFFAELEG